MGRVEGCRVFSAHHGMSLSVSKLKAQAAASAGAAMARASTLTARATEYAGAGVGLAKQTLGSQSAEEKAAKAAEKAAAAEEKAAKMRAEFREALHAAIAANIDAFLELAATTPTPQLYPRPGAAVPVADMSGTARRLTPLAAQALSLAGFGTVATLAKVAAVGMSGVLLTPAFQVFVQRVVPMLSRHTRAAGLVCASGRAGAREAELALRLYYLGCTEAMNTMCRTDEAAQLVGPDASDDVLQKLGDWVGPVQWLYAAYDLPAPHNTSAWAAWYAAQLAARSGWQTVACVGAASTEACCVPTHPPTPFPAWLLAAQPEQRRAVLTVRGSKSQNDWRINFHSEAEALDIGGLPYHVHGGMLRAARAILDDCGCRAALDRLHAAGYSLTIVGHSLGAGVAALLTALLIGTFPSVACFGFASPACVDQPLADRIKSAAVALVYNDDLVPRLSDACCHQLALELVADDPLYKQRLAKDRSAYYKYVKTLGRVHAMSHADLTAEGSSGDDGGGDEGGNDGGGGTAAPDAPDDVMAAQEATMGAGSSGRGSSEPGSCAGLDGDGDDGDGNEEEGAAVTDGPVLVVPGRVVFLHGREGATRAIEGDAQLPTLRRIVVSQRAASDHNMDKYALALRTVWRARGHVPPTTTPVRFAPVRSPGGQWEPCTVCGSDVIWVCAVAASDASRVGATHHCRSCGQVCCAFCAPAGDQVAGDAIGAFHSLPDRRCPLPSRGHLEPVRVCRPCSYDGYAL